MPSPQLSRRQMMATSTATLASTCLVNVAGANVFAGHSPNDKINLGVIGIGPRCTYDLTAMLKFNDIRCVAIADVQASRRIAGKKLVDDTYGNQDCVLFRDFRELLDRKEIDAVLVATGDRWHAPASILAAQAGKDVL